MEQQTGSSKLTAALEGLAQAKQAHARETQRLEAAGAELAALAKEILAVDPDGDPKGFAKTAAERDAARSRLDALRDRVAAAATALDAAKATAKDAQEEHVRAQLAELDAEILAKDAALTRDVRQCADRLIAGVRELAALDAKANELGRSLPLERGAGYYIEPLRGTWARATPLRVNVLLTAQGLVGE